VKEEDERPLVFIHEHERASQVGLVCSIEGPVNRVVTTRTRRKDESGRHSPLVRQRDGRGVRKENAGPSRTRDGGGDDTGVSQQRQRRASLTGGRA